MSRNTKNQELYWIRESLHLCTSNCYTCPKFNEGRIPLVQLDLGALVFLKEKWNCIANIYELLNPLGLLIVNSEIPLLGGVQLQYMSVSNTQ